MKLLELEFTEFSVSVHTGDEEEHDMFNLHPGFLFSEKILPDEWGREVTVDMWSPFFCAYRFETGIRLHGDRDRLVVSKSQNLKLGTDPEVTEPIKSYIRSHALDTFLRIEMNWKIRSSVDKPLQRITEHFLHPDLPSVDKENTFMVPIFSFERKPLLLTYRFSPDQEEEFVSIECRLNTDSFDSDEELLDGLSLYTENEKVMLSTLSTLVEISYDHQ